ncbi:hypothetical protein [Bartonella tamiae]|uniref:hypothetical protein n=1 Tax=Bartonella tamiae TaxID=373638 RepID=UPI0003153971|nr:hypothetical protein [Bartonella tamiae]
MRQWTGHRTWIATNNDEVSQNDTEVSNFWMKLEGLTSHINPNRSKTISDDDVNIIKT